MGVISESKKTDLHNRIKSIVDAFTSQGNVLTPEDTQRIWDAYEYAYACHAGVIRKSGEPYIEHAVASTEGVLQLKPDLVTIISTLLHDTTDDGAGSLTEIREKFGDEVADIVDAIVQIGKMKYRGKQSTIEKLQRTFLNIATDIRIVLVKFAERMHNLQTLQFLDNVEKAERIAYESLDIYAPIAGRLGLYELKELIESEAFRFLHPAEYLSVTGAMAHYSEEQHAFLTSSIQKIESLLGEMYPYEVTYRIKKPFSIYRKMQKYSTENIRDIYDLFALRVITQNVEHCYGILGLIHSHYKPMPGRVKDYISSPKPNGYQSLHTTVLGLYDDHNQKPTEIQIRTQEMDDIANYGQAAHHRYKLGIESSEELADYLSDAISARYEPGKIRDDDITIFTFTPRGDVIELPQQSTPIDFAYAIHSDIGASVQSARINGRIAPVSATLKNGDIIDIATSPSNAPKIEWLDFVKTSKARQQIHSYLSKESGEYERVMNNGLKLLNDRLKVISNSVIDGDSHELLSEVDGSFLSEKQRKELLYMVGNLQRKPGSVVRKIPKRKIEWKEGVLKGDSKTLSVDVDELISESQRKGVIIGGQHNLGHTFAKCCRPTYPNPIVGIVKNEGKIMIHSSGCPSIQRSNPARRLNAFWEFQSRQDHVFEVEIIAEEIGPQLKILTEIVYELQCNIISIVTQKQSHGSYPIKIEVEARDENFYELFQDRLEQKMPGYLSSKILSHVSKEKKGG